MTETGERHTTQLRAASDEIQRRINDFTLLTFQCRGGRIGSGMGTLLEALWGFYARQVLDEANPGEYEIAWIVDHAYNDFALLEAGSTWDGFNSDGELLRIEAKSMNLGADESKGHFDPLREELGEDDLLLVLVWYWAEVSPGSQLVFPKIVGEFLGPAREIAALRDALHEARGGSFVLDGNCPDGDGPGCAHVGEPLNANGIRERRSGPESARTSGTTHAANFGGLVRMVKVRGGPARSVLDEQLRYPIRREYFEFVTSFPSLMGS